MEILFWASALLITYVYVGYPAMLAVWARLVGRRPVDAPARSLFSRASRSSSRRATKPAVCGARLDNLLALDYPADRRQIIVVSDGSTDATPAVLATFGDAIETVTLPPSGKAAALNAGVARARHDIVVFADARQTFAPDALRALVSPFADPRVGGVTGELILGCETTGGRRHGADRRGSERRHRPSESTRRSLAERRGHFASTIGEGVGLYWRYEKALRRLETTVGSTLGATGAIYALRRSLWQPLPDDTLLDDVLAPMRAVLAGSRVIFEERATAFDHTPPDSVVRGAPEGSHARRQRPDSLARAAAARPARQSGLGAVRVAQDRTPGRSLRAAGAARGEHRARRPPSILHAVARGSVRVLPAGRLRRLARTEGRPCVDAAPSRRRSLVDRAARVAFAFLVLNASAVAGLFAALLGKKVWSR